MIRLNVGMDQSAGTRGAEPGTLEVVKNCRVRSGGLVKRCGSSAITATGTGVASDQTLTDSASTPRPTEKAAFVGLVGDQRVAGNSSGNAFIYRGSKWGCYGGFSAAQPVRKRLGLTPEEPISQSGATYPPGCAVSSDGYIATAVAFGSELRFSVESPTAAIVYSARISLATASAIVRVVCVGSVFYICYQRTNSTTVSVVTLTVADGVVTLGGPATLVTLANADSTWDASNYDEFIWFLVYQSGATTVSMSRMSGTSATTTVTFSTTDNLTYLSVWADPVTDRVWVGSVDDPTGTPAAEFRVYTDTPQLSIAATALTLFGATAGAPLFGPLYVRSPAAGDAFCVYAETFISPTRAAVHEATIEAGSVTRQNLTYGMLPISKPDFGHRVWCTTYASGTNFAISRVVLLRYAGVKASAGISGMPIVELASPEMEYSGTNYVEQSQLGRAFHAVGVTTEAAGGSAVFAFPMVLETRTNSSGGKDAISRIDVYQYTRQNQEPHRQLLRAGQAYVAGQLTELFGGASQGSTTIFSTAAVELGFVHAPSIIAATATPDANGLAAGSYVYQAIQQWVDDEGILHLSPPSEPYSLTLAVPSSVALQITNCYVGQRPDLAKPLASQSPPTLIYRTQNGGTEAQEVPITTSEPGASWSGYVTATDTIADSIIDDNEFLYTAGGVLPNVLAPSCRYIAVSEERLWCGGLWESNEIECSKVRVPGEPYNFTGDASHRVVIPGEVTGLAYMDGQVCVFTDDAIYLVSGDGPNDQGAGSFPPPRALVRGVGCPREQSASILETEIGILFRSKMGFYLIPRGYGSPEYIGEKVHNEDDLVLSSATTTTENYRLARFLVCASGETKSDTVLTLDITDGQWFRDEYQVNGSITGQGFSEIGEWPDGLALMSYGLDRADNANVIWAEDEDLTGDAGADGAGATTYIAQYIRTNWIQVAGPLGLMRLAEVVFSAEPIGSSSSVTMTIETDANADDSKAWTLTTSEEVAYRSNPVSQPQCTEFRVTLQDAAGASNSAGVRFLALGFQTQIIPGIRRVTDSQGN